MTNYKGIYCFITWNDDEPTDEENYEAVFIAFSEDPLAGTDCHDIIEDDLATFFYFEPSETSALMKAISDREKTFSVDDSWVIDLSEGYDLVS